MKKQIFQVFILLMISFTAFAQVGINTDGMTPDASAMLDSNKPLAEIASDFAFSYQSHFSKWFKNIAKISPAEYRRKFSGETDFRP